ncbi:Cyclin-dependent kinase inhibitor 3-like protein [Drosera capensis]
MLSRRTRPTLNPISGGGEEMGKYMKKSKTTTTTATANDVSPSSLGVRTRARTLALQQGSNSSSPPTPPSSPAAYLQLRNRRLLKSLVSGGEKGAVKESSRNRVCSVQNPNPNPSENCESAEDGGNNAVECQGDENGDDGVGAAAVEACFGENVLDSEARGRSTRESTPCSLIRNQDSIHTPGSTTRPVSAAEAIRRSEGSMRRRIPTTQEMEEFFAGLEKEQQKQFIEKYNFDPVNDTPLPGRFEWEVRAAGERRPCQFRRQLKRLDDEKKWFQHNALREEEYSAEGTQNICNKFCNFSKLDLDPMNSSSVRFPVVGDEGSKSQDHKGNNEA